MNATFPPATATAASTSTPSLGPGDRCDRCGAKAQVRAILPSGFDLMFCGHHAREHEAALIEQEITVSR
jgi:hypothetical protein